eukprot:UN03372
MRAPEYEYLVQRRTSKKSKHKTMKEETQQLVREFAEYRGQDKNDQRRFFHVPPNPMLDDLIIHLDLDLQTEWNSLMNDPDKYIKFKLKHVFPDPDDEKPEPFGVGNPKSPHRRFHHGGLGPTSPDKQDLDYQGKPYHPPVEDLLTLAFTTNPTVESAELFKRAINGVDDDYVYDLKPSDVIKRPIKTTSTVSQLNELLNNPQLRAAFHNPYRLPKS